MSDEKRSEDELPEGTKEESTGGALAESAKSAEGADADVKTDGDVALAERGDSDESSDDGEEGESEDDAANPAAIARRVAALGADDESEALAREEERKLAERRAAGKKKGKKKTGLETAASKKLSKIGTRAEPKRTIAVAADADPLIERTAKLSEWAKKNQKVVQVVGAALCVGLLAVAGFLYYDHKRETEASTGLTKAVEAQQAQIGEPKKDEEEDDKNLYFKTYDDRRAAALKQYKEVQAKFPAPALRSSRAWPRARCSSTSAMRKVRSRPSPK